MLLTFNLKAVFSIKIQGYKNKDFDGKSSTIWKQWKRSVFKILKYLNLNLIFKILKYYIFQIWRVRIIVHAFLLIYIETNIVLARYKRNKIYRLIRKNDRFSHDLNILFWACVKYEYINKVHSVRITLQRERMKTYWQYKIDWILVSRQ